MKLIKSKSLKFKKLPFNPLILNANKSNTNNYIILHVFLFFRLSLCSRLISCRSKPLLGDITDLHPLTWL